MIFYFSIKYDLQRCFCIISFLLQEPLLAGLHGQHGDQSGQARGKHTGCHLHLLLRREPGAHQEHRASLPRRRLEAETSEDEALSQRCAQLLAPNVLLVRGGRHAGEQGCRGGNIFSKRAV